jgi:hypothetical protein
MAGDMISGAASWCKSTSQTSRTPRTYDPRACDFTVSSALLDTRHHTPSMPSIRFVRTASIHNITRPHQNVYESVRLPNHAPKVGAEPGGGQSAIWPSVGSNKYAVIHSPCLSPWDMLRCASHISLNAATQGPSTCNIAHFTLPLSESLGNDQAARIRRSRQHRSESIDLDLELNGNRDVREY